MNLVFLAPMLLLGLLVLPVLWWLLRATPPAPKRIRFPGVQLLLGLVDKEQAPDKTPIWLLILRMLAIAAAIFAFAEPILNPALKDTKNGPLLVLMDGGWSSAEDWDARVNEAERVLKLAAANGRPTVFLSLAKPLPLVDQMPFQDASTWLNPMRALTPQAWPPQRAEMVEWLADKDASFDTIWLTDGLGFGADLAEELANHGTLDVRSFATAPIALRPVELRQGMLSIDAISTKSNEDRLVSVTAFGPAPNGIETALGQATAMLSAGKSEVTLTLEMPLELRNRVTRIQLDGAANAGAVSLLDDSAKRRKVALVRASVFEGPQLTDPLHFLRKALGPTSTLIEGGIAEVLRASPDVIILSDVAGLSILSTRQLLDWVEGGGQLLRFAGPNLAAGVEQQDLDDPLLPVRLRIGGRNLGGAMSWSVPKGLQEFTADSPFFGLEIPDDITVTQQVIAQPGPDLAGHVLANLDDGTPLVTARSMGEGRVILFHITANAEWSSLPLSGLFVQMLERLAVGAGNIGSDTQLEGRSWTPTILLDGFGGRHVPNNPTPVDGGQLASERGPNAGAGLYRAGDVSVAVNVIGAADVLTPIDIEVTVIGDTAEVSLKPWLLLAALSLLAIDILATLWVTGRLTNIRAGHVATAILALAVFNPPEANAGDELALQAANDTVLAYVITGVPEVDAVSAAGLRGIGEALTLRTAIEPAAPVGVNLEADPLALFPLLYWPITAGQVPLTDKALENVNRYMNNGGMILFDTQDAHLGGGLGTTTANGRMLQQIAGNLDIPPLTPVPEGHVLTKAFYLLDDFPGRWDRTDVWVQVANGGVDNSDGVTPVIIGANDWAGAWAVTATGAPMFPVGRGVTGVKQREMSRRFGVNLVMYVMTGNYKSDQVHVPELLERLGQ